MPADPRTGPKPDVKELKKAASKADVNPPTPASGPTPKGNEEYAPEKMTSAAPPKKGSIFQMPDLDNAPKTSAGKKSRFFAEVTLERDGKEQIGIGLVQQVEPDDVLKKQKLFVDMIMPGSLGESCGIAIYLLTRAYSAARSKSLIKGDILVHINGVSLNGKSPLEALDILNQVESIQ